MDLARLTSIDAELDGFGVEPSRLDAVSARAREQRLALDAVDAALESLGNGRVVETMLPSEGIPEGVVARPGSWERRSSLPSALPSAPGSGLVELDPALIEASQLPPALTEPPPPSGDEVPVAPPRVDGQLADDGERSSIEISIEAGDQGAFAEYEGTEVHGHDDGPAAAVDDGIAASALELELEGESTDLPSSVTQSSAKFSVPHDSPHPSPRSVIPPPPPGADLDAELASILADELENAAAPAGQPLGSGPEGTGRFSAGRFGAAGDEPSLAELVSRPPPPDVDAAADSLEIEIDEDVLVYEAEPAAPPTGTRPPPPPSRSAPPAPGKPGFLGRLLNRKG